MRNICLISVLVSVFFAIGSVHAQDAGKALDFDGTDDNVVISGTIDPADQGTVEFWINADASDSRRVMGGHDAFEVRLDPATNGYVIDHQFFIGGSDTLHAITALPFGEWHHIACTWDLSTKTAQIYIDGGFDVAGDQAADDPGAFAFTIGTRTGSNSDYFDGRLDEIRIWNEVRAERQIQEYMLRQLANPASEQDLLAYWRLDEADGKDCTDYSGNGFNGEMTNMDPANARIVSSVPISIAVLPAGDLSTTWGELKKR